MKQIPEHIAIIMDGNGRWAEKKGAIRYEGHRAGVESVKTIINCCLTHKVAVLSLFAFSSENWNRPQEEVEFLMSLFLQALGKQIDELVCNGIALRFTGSRAQLSDLLQQQMTTAEQLTANNRRLTVNVVINYGGRWDIVQAVKKIANSVVKGATNLDDIDESLFASLLSTATLPDPDLFIRTSGEKRISNYFLWQLAYTELYFTDVHWPDFTAYEFEKALLCFKQRERRYGKTSHQLNEASHV